MKLALLVEYNGKGFSGSQYQAGVRTVQEELEKALTVLARQPIKVTFSGRTDAGVHARGQVGHFNWSNENVDLSRLTLSINGILPQDMSVPRCQLVTDSFHARYQAISREYVYRLLNRSQRSPLLSGNHYFVPQVLDVDLMSTIAPALVGKHDFTAFKSSRSDTDSAICTVHHAELLNLGEGVLEFRVVADHFVYNMIRIIVGTLLEIGLGKRHPQSLYDALDQKDRSLAGPTAPAWGLCLESVRYPEEYQLFLNQ